MKNQNDTQSRNQHIMQSYFDALTKGDLLTLGSLFAEDVIWHQPGNGQLSGTHQGKPAVFELFGRFMEISGGSFKINFAHSPMANGDLVSAVLSFSASKKTGEKISMEGVDLMRIEHGKIKEVYLFSADQAVEDAFWG